MTRNDLWTPSSRRCRAIPQYRTRRSPTLRLRPEWVWSSEVEWLGRQVDIQSRRTQSLMLQTSCYRSCLPLSHLCSLLVMPLLPVRCCNILHTGSSYPRGYPWGSYGWFPTYEFHNKDHRWSRCRGLRTFWGSTWRLGPMINFILGVITEILILHPHPE